MSKIAVSSNPSGTGTFTIESPATNTDRVLTLPDEAGTVLTNSGYITADGTNLILKADGTNEDARIDSSGTLIINDTAGGVTGQLSNPYLHIKSTLRNGIVVEENAEGYSVLAIAANGNSGTRYAMYILNGSYANVGSISYTSSATSYNTSSDYRLKENVVDMTGAIDRVKALKPSRFNFIVDPDKTVDGFLAHEAQSVVPEAVTGTHDEVDDEGNAVYQGIDQSKLVPLLTGALKEAIARIETLEAKVAALEATP